MHPYQMAQTLRNRAKEHSIRLNYGSLYGVVENLEKRKLVQARETLREGRRPERTIYEITEAGAREALDWLSDMISVPVKEYPQLVAALSFVVALPPSEAMTALQCRYQALQLRLLQMAGMRRAAAEAGLPDVFSLESELEQALVDTELKYVGDLIDRIATGSLDGLPMWRAFHEADDETLKRLAAEVAQGLPWPGPESRERRTPFTDPDASSE